MRDAVILEVGDRGTGEEVVFPSSWRCAGEHAAGWPLELHAPVWLPAVDRHQSFGGDRV
jgi:hypothetical protein